MNLEPTAWSARILPVPGELASRRPLAAAFTRRHRLELGPPVSFDREDGHLSAVEALAGALGADLVNGFRMLARERRLLLHAVEAWITVELANPLVFLGVIGEEGDPGVRRVGATLYVNAGAPEATVREAFEESLRRSPLFATMRRAAEVSVELRCS